MFIKSKLFSVLLVLALLVVACAPAEESPPEVATSEVIATSEPIAEPTEEATEEALPATGPTAEPTQAATDTPTAEPTEEAAATPAAQRVGILRFRDGGDVRSGSVQLALEGIDPPPAGTHYELWLTDENHNALNLGALPVGSQVEYTATADQHLLGNYTGAFISVEPDGASDAEIGANAFRGELPPAALGHIRHVVYQFPDNPEGQGFLVGADEQLRLAAEHAGFLRDELAAGNLEVAKRHAEHVVNILDGETGTTFGDLDGDGVAQNPGDGLGVRSYFEGARQHAQFAADTEDATAEVKLHAGHTIVSSDNVLGWLDEAIQQAVRVVSSDTAEEAQTGSGELTRLLELAVNGQDVNGDGAVAPVEGEGGLLIAYEHAQNMGSVEFYPAEGIDAAGAPGEELATVTPEVEAPATEAPAAALEPVTIEMTNFSYQPGDITIPAGTTVTWVNRDQVRHSATAVDGSFDTGLFGAGEEASVTFDQPGTYTYYCLLHGTPQGEGMSGTITVEAAAGAPAAPAASAAGQATGEAPAQPAAGEAVTIAMRDFEFSQPSLTVPVGSTVTWVNEGSVRHSATADDSSFNTGLLDPGGSVSVTLDQPGTYPYYCELHGASGGQGMAGTIVVGDAGGSGGSTYTY